MWAIRGGAGVLRAECGLVGEPVEFFFLSHILAFDNVSLACNEAF